MNRQELFNQIKNKRSFLCVGLDPDLDKMPKSLNGDLFAFNKAIIDATAQYLSLIHILISPSCATLSHSISFAF